MNIAFKKSACIPLLAWWNITLGSFLRNQLSAWLSITYLENQISFRGMIICHDKWSFHCFIYTSYSLMFGLDTSGAGPFRFNGNVYLFVVTNIGRSGVQNEYHKTIPDCEISGRLCEYFRVKIHKHCDGDMSDAVKFKSTLLSWIEVEINTVGGLDGHTKPYSVFHDLAPKQDVLSWEPSKFRRHDMWCLTTHITLNAPAGTQQHWQNYC